MKTVGIVGLGLIGGSMARAYKLYSDSDCQVLGMDRDKATLDVAMLTGAVDRPLTADNIGTCELLLIALFPGATVEFFAGKRQPDFSRRTGHRSVRHQADGLRGLLPPGGAVRLHLYRRASHGRHPQIRLFRQPGGAVPGRAHGAGAPAVSYAHIALLERAKRALAPAGFGRFSVTTAQAHDAMIAFTSQLAHIVSGAYIKSPTARKHKGFSAGSYRDMTRVAWLNPDMWTELFLEDWANA